MALYVYRCVKLKSDRFHAVSYNISVVMTTVSGQTAATPMASSVSNIHSTELSTSDTRPLNKKLFLYFTFIKTFYPFSIMDISPFLPSGYKNRSICQKFSITKLITCSKFASKVLESRCWPNLQNLKFTIISDRKAISSLLHHSLSGLEFIFNHFFNFKIM